MRILVWEPELMGREYRIGKSCVQRELVFCQGSPHLFWKNAGLLMGVRKTKVREKKALKRTIKSYSNHTGIIIVNENTQADQKKNPLNSYGIGAEYLGSSYLSSKKWLLFRALLWTWVTFIKARPGRIDLFQSNFLLEHSSRILIGIWKISST